jgi:Zn-dependent protease
MLTAIAGPISNMIQAAVAALLLAGMVRLHLVGGELSVAFFRILAEFLELNIVLAVFNLFPIPPLDGSRVAAFLMPRRFEPAWEKFVRITPIPLLALIMLPRLTDNRIDLIGPPIRHVMDFAMHIIQFLSG